MPRTDKTFIAATRHLLWLRVTNASDGTVTVHNYHPFKTIHRKLTLTPTYLAREITKVSSKKNEENWKTRANSTNRIIAQRAQRRTQARDFVLHYYSIGFEKERLASYFILDADGRQPELPGYFDWQAPIDASDTDKFFELTTKTKPTHSDRWALWEKSKTAFQTKQRYTIVLSLSAGSRQDGDIEYLGLDVRSELHEYPHGRLIGGLPFGAEDKFLAMCMIDAANPEPWTRVHEEHKKLFNAWNVICREDSKLTRIFIEGDPGTGKELWFEAIQKGSRPHRKGVWQTLSATLTTKAMQSILYGERDGALERKGLLASCAGGGVFLDEIGKSDKEFRRDLLRVLEAKEFVPGGGLPTSIDNVLFIFASTATDRKSAYDPPDFWTRMDIVLTLPAQITLVRPKDAAFPMSEYDKDRFHSLLGHFWFHALKRARFADPDLLLRTFRENVFEPIVLRLAEVAAADWKQSDAQNDPAERIPERIPVSPRRIQSLATTLSSEYRWVGVPISESRSEKTDAQTAADFWTAFRAQFVDDFFRQLVRDQKNTEATRLRPKEQGEV